MVETEEAVERDKTRAGCVASATGCVGGVVVDRVEGGVNGPVVVCANGLVANGLVMGFGGGPGASSPLRVGTGTAGTGAASIARSRRWLTASKLD